MTKSYSKGGESGTITLSPSKLNVLKECARCFWLENVKGRKRPSGPFPSLPRGIDTTLKTHYDNYRGSVTPEIVGKVPGVLLKDQVKLNAWREWRTGAFAYRDSKLDVFVRGALDDCLVDGDFYMPFDYKTKNAAPKTDGSEYYQVQLDCYSLFFRELGLKTNGKGFLAYYFPLGVAQPSEGEVSKVVPYDFGCQVFELKCDTSRAEAMIVAAVAVIRMKTPPAPDPDCDFCKFVVTAARECAAPAPVAA